jgi:lipopolysaccharide export system protein LptA
MKTPFPHLLLVAALALGGGLAHAEKADRNKPMNVEADSLRYDDTKQINIFSGRVVLTKGSIIIRGARVEVRQDAGGHQYGLVTAEPGNLAFFRQKREGLDEYIEGEGDIIEYDGQADTVKFLKSAQLRRYRGVTLADELSGGVIVYNNTTDVFSVDGAQGKAKPGVPVGRVRAVLSPKQDPAASGPAAAASSAAPALRSTTTLDGEKR